MLKRILSIVGVTSAIALAVVSAAVARPDAVRSVTAGSSCKTGVQIGMLAPITGAAASIGGDQLHWAQYFVSEWNKTGKVKLKLVQGDTQLEPAKASTVAQQFASNQSIVAVIGPAGSQEVVV